MSRATKAFASFLIHCLLAFLLGGLFAFFFTVRFSPNSVLDEGGAGDDSSLSLFFDSKDRASAAFSAAALSTFIREANFSDFKLKNRSSGSMRQTPRFEINSGKIALTLDISAPILGATSVRPLRFEGRASGGKLKLTNATFGEAKIPLFIAKILFSKMKSGYAEGPNARLAIDRLSGAKILNLKDSEVEISK